MAASLLLTIAAIVLFLIHLYCSAYSRPPNFPPGPPRLPLWGSYWILLLNNYTFTHVAIRKLARKYKTKVLGFFLGPFPTVVATDYDSVHEMLTRPEYLGRPDTIVSQSRALGKRFGIFFNDGLVWKDQRRFMLKNMRDFGFGRRFTSTEEVLQEEIRDLLDMLRGEWTDEEVCKNGSVLFPAAFYPIFINLLWSMLGGKRHGREEYPHIRKLCRGALQFVRNVEPLGGAISLTPWLQHIAPRATGLEDQIEGNQVLLDEMKNAIDEHRATFSDDHMRDFIDLYIQRMKEQVEDGSAVTFSDEQLMLVGTDMLLASATTVTGTLTFAFRALLRHPEVQKKIQDELDKVVGRDKLPTLNDRTSLPYTEATLREVMRRNTLLPLALPHLSTEDTQFQGYSIPKYTLMFASLYDMHMDPALWGDPEAFRPERFLEDNGSMKKKDLSSPFGIGKRLCPGETFSRQSMFVLFASLLQNFSFSAAHPDSVPAYDDDVKPGLAVSPHDIWVTVHPRQ